MAVLEILTIPDPRLKYKSSEVKDYDKELYLIVKDMFDTLFASGNGFGLAVIFLTFYATQYSGNTLFGYSGMTYRIGYAWIMCIHFMTAIIACYLIFAPKLYQRARRFNYITPTDYLQHRFCSNSINIIVTVIMIFVLSNYLLAQLMAMGRAMQGLSSADPNIAYQQGVILLTLIMVIYGTLGGIRAVAWLSLIHI